MLTIEQNSSNGLESLLSIDFDPYHKWLGIPPSHQPASHYRLLGLAEYEGDPEVISYAVDQRMMHIKSFQSGRFAKCSQKILNELAAAKVCLLNVEMKVLYDAQLQTTNTRTCEWRDFVSQSFRSRAA